jgi:hypothetical protein
MTLRTRPTIFARSRVRRIDSDVCCSAAFWTAAVSLCSGCWEGCDCFEWTDGTHGTDWLAGNGFWNRCYGTHRQYGASGNGPHWQYGSHRPDREYGASGNGPHWQYGSHRPDREHGASGNGPDREHGCHRQYGPHRQYGSHRARSNCKFCGKSSDGKYAGS